MDEMQQPEVDSDSVIIELLTELVQQGRAKRAEGVMAPPPVEAPPPEAAAGEMEELEAMLGESPLSEAAEGEAPCPKCGKTPCEC